MSDPQRTVFIKSSGEVQQPPRQGMRSSADSLGQKKRFIGERRGEPEWRGEGGGWEGRGEARQARRTAVGRTPAMTGDQQTHLAARLSAKRRNSRLLSSALDLNSYLRDLFYTRDVYFSKRLSRISFLRFIQILCRKKKTSDYYSCQPESGFFI